MDTTPKTDPQQIEIEAMIAAESNRLRSIYPALTVAQADYLARHEVGRRVQGVKRGPSLAAQANAERRAERSYAERGGWRATVNKMAEKAWQA